MLKFARLSQEVEAHNSTRIMLVQTQSTARYWENRSLAWQCYVRSLSAKLDALQKQHESLRTESERLNIVVKYLVRISSHYIDRKLANL